MNTAHGVTILGSTGSIGVNTLDVIARHAQRFRVVALTAHTQSALLLEQCQRYRPRYAVLLLEKDAHWLAQSLRAAGIGTEVLWGAQALEHVARLPEVETVVAAIVGSAGLKPTLEAARAGKRVLLANKEALVMAGALLMDAARAGGASLLPIDSEHNAIFQSLPARAPSLVAAGVERILLTASGGPFRTLPLEQLEYVSPEQACRHPNWVMGRKISVDSATMMNKGLEVIEACWLFGARPEQVEIVIHPESIIHSLVAYRDGSVLAQLSYPDMRTPIAHALGYPHRLHAGVAALDLVKVGQLNFAPLDRTRFPCVALAEQSFARGGSAPAVLNAANEIAVAAFLERQISFTDIARVIEQTLARTPIEEARGLEQVLRADALAREQALLRVQERARAREPVSVQR